MQLTTLLASALSLAAGSSAAAIGARQGVDNPRLAQFRIWSADGCDRANEGFYTVETDMANKCHPLNVAPVVSVMLEVWTPAAANCRCKCYPAPPSSRTSETDAVKTHSRSLHHARLLGAAVRAEPP